MTDRGVSGSNENRMAPGSVPVRRRIARFGSIWDPVQYYEEESPGEVLVTAEGGGDVSGGNGVEGEGRAPRERRGVWFRRRRSGTTRTEERGDGRGGAQRRGGIWRALRRVFPISV